jgi:hypothetical protein
VQLLEKELHDISMLADMQVAMQKAGAPKHDQHHNNTPSNVTPHMK